MNTLTLSATDFRNQLFPLIDRVSRGEIVVTVIKEDTKSKITIAKTVAKMDKSFARIAEKTYGILKDVPETEFYDDRLRGKRAKQYLDRLRKPW